MTDKPKLALFTINNGRLPTVEELERVRKTTGRPELIAGQIRVYDTRSAGGIDKTHFYIDASPVERNTHHHIKA